MGNESYNMISKLDRGHFIKSGILLTASAIGAVGFLSSCHAREKEKEVSPPEDLMQEHGLLNRVLLIYEHCRQSLTKGQALRIENLNDAASVIKSFIEDYHEKQEEEYLFPRFEKAGQLIELVRILRLQHDKGREITGQLIQLSKIPTQTESENQKIIALLSSFITMYRPHEAREDTVLFPAFRKLVSTHEYDSLGEEFERNEEKHFGQDGFEKMVARVSEIEKSIGIYDLSQFTP